MGFNKIFGSKAGVAFSKTGQDESMPLLGLTKAVPKPGAQKGSTGLGFVELEDIKNAVASYSIQRRVLETLFDALQASLRQEHAMDLSKFKRSLKDHAFDVRNKRHSRTNRKQHAGYSCFDEPTSCEECISSACIFVYQKLAIARFMVLQHKERTMAARDCEEQLDGLRKDFGDCIMPERNGGIREADCAREKHELLVDWGLASMSTEMGGREWEDDLRDMVRLGVSEEKEARAKLRLAASGNVHEKALRVSACTRPSRLSVVFESCEED